MTDCPAGIPCRVVRGPAKTAMKMKKSPSVVFDGKEGYCRILGHHVHFSYCRTCQESMPCSRILDCWFENFDIRKFVEENYTEEEIKNFLQPPKPKMQTLMSLIQQAQERMKKGE
jgi:hypothetical protein